MLNYAQARERLIDMTQATVDPQLDNAKQVLSVTGGVPTSGSFQLTFQGAQTAVIVYNATAAQVLAALEALSNIETGDVAVTGGPFPGATIKIEFRGQYSQVDVAILTAVDTFNAGDVAITKTQPEIDRLLAQFIQQSVWVTATGYNVGDTVVPTKTNGRRYRMLQMVTTTGISGAIEPTWPTGFGATVTDGDVIWQENGPAYQELYNLRAAASRGWELKAGKSSNRFDFSVDSQSFKASQTPEFCLKMANRFRNMTV